MALLSAITGDYIARHTLISVRNSGGETLLEYTVTESTDVYTQSLVVQSLLVRSLEVPRKCITLLWSSSSESLGNSVEMHVLCSLVSIPTTEAFLNDQDGASYCFVCGDPCADADLHTEAFGPAWQRAANCRRCLPCQLCGQCSVVLPDGPCCFACIEEGEEVDLTPTQRRRLGLVNPEMCI